MKFRSSMSLESPQSSVNSLFKDRFCRYILFFDSACALRSADVREEASKPPSPGGCNRLRTCGYDKNPGLIPGLFPYISDLYVYSLEEIGSLALVKSCHSRHILAAGYP